MHIVFLVEELSAEAALLNLVPRILGASASFEIHPYQCKEDLLSRLPQVMRGYAKWLPDDWRIVVLVDEDRSDCEAWSSSTGPSMMPLSSRPSASSSTPIPPRSWPTTTPSTTCSSMAWRWSTGTKTAEDRARLADLEHPVRYTAAKPLTGEPRVKVAERLARKAAFEADWGG